MTKREHRRLDAINVPNCSIRRRLPPRRGLFNDRAIDSMIRMASSPEGSSRLLLERRLSATNPQCRFVLGADKP
jgi:hypothetical protein